MQIQTRHKTTILPLGKGYNKRKNFSGKYTIIVHSTNNPRKGTSYQSELKFLYESSQVSAHYLIGKDGTITELVPIEYCAYHAGMVHSAKYNNNNSIGIELHYTPGEIKYLPKQRDALIWLCRKLIKENTVIGIETHRRVAKPKGRKSDPSNYTDEEFEQLKAEIYKKWYTAKKGAVLFTAPENNNEVADHISEGSIQNGIVINPFTFEGLPVQNGYIWVVTGIGFFKGDSLE